MLVGDLVTRYTADMQPFIQGMKQGSAAHKEFEKGIVDGMQQALNAHQKTADGVQRGNRQMSDSFRGVSSELKNIAGLFGVSLGVAAVANFLRSTTEMIGRLQDLSQQTGIAASTLSRLKSPLEEGGASVESFARSISFAQRQISEITKSSDPALKAIKDLEFSFDALVAATPEEFMRMVITASAGVEDQNKKTELGTKLLGRQFRELIPVLGDVTKALDDLNGGLSDEQIARIDEFGDAWVRMWNQVAFATADATLNIIDYLDRLDKRIGEAGENFRKSFRDFLSGLHGFELVAPEGPEGAPLGHPQSHIPAPPPRGAPGRRTLDAEDTAKKAEALTKSLQGQIVALQAQTMEFEKGDEAAQRFLLTENALAQLEGQKLTPVHRQQIETIIRLTEATKEREKSVNALNRELKEQEDLEKKLNQALEDTFDMVHEIERLSMDRFTKELDDITQKFNRMLEANEKLKKLGFGVDDADIIRARQFALAIADVNEQERIWSGEIKEADPAKFIDPLLSTYENLFDSIANGMTQTIEGIMQGTQTVGEGFRRMGQNIALSLAQIIIQLEVLNPLKNAVFGSEGANVAGFQPLPTLAGIFTKLAGGLFGGGSGSGLAFGDVSDLSAQHGGIVAGPRGRAVPILAHAGEKIIPLSHADKQGNGGGVQVIVRGSIRPEPPTLSPREVIQIVANDFDNRGLTLQTAEQRMSPRR